MCDAVATEINYIQRKGGTVLLSGGYQYYKLKEYVNGSVIWRCALYKKQKCTGSVTIKDKTILKDVIPQEHKCQSDYGKNQIAMTISNLKQKVTESNKPIERLYKKAFKKIKVDGYNLVTNVPLFTSVQHSLYDMRNRSANVNKTVFKNVEDVHVPVNHYSFILAEGNRILIFCSHAAKARMSEFSEFFGDATFYACPPPFTQLYSILGDAGSTTETTKVVPLIFALLMNKKQSTYEVMFELIKTRLPTFVVKHFHCDFEVAAINAILSVFPGVSIIGCYYHWHRCVMRKGKALKCDKKPENRIVALVAALALLPAERIMEGYDYVKTESEFFEVKKLLQYVERTWMKGHMTGIISVFGKRHRTNNVIESRHSKINKILKKSPVTLMRLLETLEDQSTTKVLSIFSSKRRMQYIKIDDCIRRIQMQLINNDVSLELALEKLRSF